MRKIILSVLLSVILISSAFGEVKKWVDSEGNTHYGDIAPEKAEPVRIIGGEDRSRNQNPPTLYEYRDPPLDVQLEDTLSQISDGDLDKKVLANQLIVKLRAKSTVQETQARLTQLEDALAEGAMARKRIAEEKILELERQKASQEAYEEMKRISSEAEEKKKLERQQLLEGSTRYQEEQERKRNRDIVVSQSIISLLFVGLVTLISFSVVRISVRNGVPITRDMWALIGCVAIFFSVFSPLVSTPIGNVTFISHGPVWGAILLAIAAVASLIVLMKGSNWLPLFGIVGLSIAIYTLTKLQILQVETATARPAYLSIFMQTGWGWLLLIVGSAVITASGLLKNDFRN